MKCIYTEHCCCVSPTIFTSDIGTISDISTRDAVSVSRRSQNLNERSRLGLGCSDLGLGLDLDPEGLGPIPDRYY